MENYNLKYAADLPFPFPSIKKIKEEYLQIWKQNIIKEIFALKNLFLGKYSLYLEENIKDVINIIISLAEQYRYAFLENYLYYLGNEDKLYININDEENTFKLKFLKDIYNSILLLIDNLFSANKLLPLIYQDKLNKIIPKKNSISSNLLIQINNDDFFNKFNLDLEKLQNKLEQYKDIFNFNKNQNSIYPSEEELNKIFEEFNNKNYNKNIELQNKIKKTCNQVIKDKLISKKVDIVIPTNNPEFDELLNISKTIQEIKDEIKDIKEKQNNYCVSSLINKNLEFDEFNRIKESTFQMDGEIEGLKNEIKNYNDKYLKMMNDIEEQNIKYRGIQKKNEEINNKINTFINNVCN